MGISRKLRGGVLIAAAVGLLSAPMAAVPAQAASMPATIIATAMDQRAGTVSSMPVTTASGVTLALQVSQDSGNSRTKWNTPTEISNCVTASTGSCSLTVPASYFSSSDRWASSDREMRVVVKSAKAGYGIIGALDLDDSNFAGAGYSQAVRTSGVRAGKSYKLENVLNSDYSDGQLSMVRSNPTPIGKCGLDIGLLLDNSGSIGTEMSALKKAADSFVDTLTGTPSQIGVWSFNTAASSNLGLTSVATVASAQKVKDSYKNFSSSGGTNWDQGLSQVARSSSQLDMLVIITDGQPTYSQTQNDSERRGTGNTTPQREMEGAIWSANAVKAKGTQVYAVGVGDNLVNNLTAIAGPGAVASASNYTALTATLQELANKACASTINVVKQVTDKFGSDSGATPAAGWTFSVKGPSGSAMAGTTDASGAMSIKLPDAWAGQTVTVTETVQDGYSLRPRPDSKFATCMQTDTQAPVTVTNASGSTNAFNVTTVKGKAISCQVFNQPDALTTSVQVNHEWVDGNGETIPAEDVARIVAGDGTPKITAGTRAQSGTTYGTKYNKYNNGSTTSVDYVAGDSVAIDVASAPSLKSAYTASCKIGAAVGGDKGTFTLQRPANVYTLTHTLNCTTTLKLVKVVDGGTAKASDWKLSGTPAGGSAKVFTQNAATAVAPGVNYTLTEAGPSDGYELTGLICSNASTDLVANPKVKVPRGDAVTCTYTNSLVAMTVAKSAYAGSSNAGSPIQAGSYVATGTYTWLYTIQNTGKVALNIDSVSDNRLDDSVIKCSATVGGSYTAVSNGHKILPGKTLYCRGTGQITF